MNNDKHYRPIHAGPIRHSEIEAAEAAPVRGAAAPAPALLASDLGGSGHNG
jgi:hypothetical protein